MTDTRRSAVNRARSALRIREKSAAATPVRRGAHAETFPIERLDDFCCENGLKLFDIRTLVPEVTESISTSAHHLQLFALHRNISQIVNPWSRIPNP